MSHLQSVRRHYLPFLVGAALLNAPFASSAAPAPAEYAIRWDINDGGPQDAGQAMETLGGNADRKDTFVVRYVFVATPSPMPPGFKAIVRERERTSDRKFELTYKYRGGTPLPSSPSLNKWSCPIGNAKERKDEVDVSIRETTEARAFSRSCTIESKTVAPLVPAGLSPEPVRCSSTVTRLKAGTLTVEEWHLPNDHTVIEVSDLGPATDAGVHRFRREVATPLIAKGIKPVEFGMTELAGKCGN